MTAPTPRVPGPDDQATLPPSASAESATLPPSQDPHATLATGAPPTIAQDARAPVGYVIEKELGRGGMGVVYLARSVALHRPCALKMILSGVHSGDTEVERFKTEAQAIARLQHPGIVQVFEIGEHDGKPFMALEFCSGGSLDAKLAKNPLAPKQAATLVKALAEAVHAAHTAKVIHRDLKPANVLLTDKGEPKVTDFGLAKKLDEQGATRTGAIMGTPSYMPPEQAEGKKDIGPAADVYALGAILYECLASRAPFRAATALDTILQLLTEEPVPVRQLNPQAPVDLETICLKCLQKDPRKRYATAQELADDLGRYLNGEPIVARPVGAIERAVKWVRRNAVVSALAAAVLLVLVAGVVVSGYFAVTASEEAKVARKAEEDAETNLGLARASEAAEKEARADAVREAAEAKKARGDAQREAKEATWQARLANDARHAIQVDLALRAREDRDYDRMAAILNDMRSEYHGAWETRHVRNLWLRHAFPIRSLVGHTGGVGSVAFSPDGKRVLTGSFDSTARLWDAETGQEKALLKGHTGGVGSVAFSPDGKRVLTASLDNTARLWDAETGQEKALLKGHTLPVVSVAFSPDGKRVLTGSFDSTARLWDAETGQEKALLKGHTGGVGSVAFSPDGKRVLTGSHDSTARLWDAETGQEKALLKGHTGVVLSVAFSPDGKRVLTGGVGSVAFSPDGKRVLTGSGDKTARLWDAETGQEKAILKGHTAPVLSVAFSPDGKRVLTGSWDGTGSFDSTARLWDAETGQEKALLKGPTGGVVSVAYSPDGKRVLTGSGDSTARLWDAGTGQEKALLKGHTREVGSVAFSPDGKRVLTGSHDKTARLWDAETGKEKAAFKGHTDQVVSVAYSPDGKHVLTGSGDKTARLWDAETGQEKALLKGHAGRVGSVAFSPDGKRVLTGSGDQTARLWDAETGQEKALLKGHRDYVSSVAYSPDGKHVLTGSGDKTARLWDAETGQEKALLAGHTDGITSVAFSPDGKRVLTGSQDSTARLWDTETSSSARPPKQAGR